MAILRQTFDGGDRFAGHAVCQGDAGTRGRSIDEDGAGAAVALAAAVFATRQSEVVTEHPEEHAVGMDFEAVMFLVDDEFHSLILRPLSIWVGAVRRISRKENIRCDS